MKVCKLSVCKEPALYQSVHENISESLLHAFFLHKTIQLPPFDLQSTARFRHFTNWWHLSHFPWTTAFTCRFATSILWCYNFNGMIKWYDILCATLYIFTSTTDGWRVCFLPEHFHKSWFYVLIFCCSLMDCVLYFKLTWKCLVLQQFFPWRTF